MGVELTPDSFPNGVRKCPKHKSWILVDYNGRLRLKRRYCPVCDMEKAKADKEAGIKPPEIKFWKY